MARMFLRLFTELLDNTTMSLEDVKETSQANSRRAVMEQGPSIEESSNRQSSTSQTYEDLRV